MDHGRDMPLAGVEEKGQHRLVRSALAALADFAWPPVCPMTGVSVDVSGHVAPSAWYALTFLDAPHCARCGRPFPYPGGTGAATAALCAACIARPPAFDLARAPLAYDEASRPLVLGFKHGGRREMIAQFARWMAGSAPECLEGADAIVPVPLHWRRLWARRYNQSALLGDALARLTGLPLETRWLLRPRATPSQAGRSAGMRRRNVAGAFHVPDRQAVEGRTLVLVDDVFTTGATASACARLLKRRGAARVHVMTLCRVVRETDLTI